MSLRTSIIIDLAGNLAARANELVGGFHRLGAQGSNSLKTLHNNIQAVGQRISEVTQRIGFMGNAMTALSTGLVLKKIFSLEDFMPVDDALLRMRNNLQATDKEMDIFKKQLATLAGKEGIDLGETFQGANKLSLNYKEDDILTIIKSADKASKAMKEPIDVVQDRVVEILRLYKLAAKEAPDVANALVASRVNVESLDVALQRLALRGGSKKEYTQTLGMLRGLNMAGLTSNRVIVQLNTTLQALQDKADILESAGIKVRKINADGTTEWRDQLEVLKDLESYLDKWKKKIPLKEFDEKLDKVFGPNARQNLDFVFKQKENFKKGIEEMSHASEIAEGRAGAAAATWENQLKRVKASLGSIKTDLSWIYDLAKKPVKFLADHPAATKAAGYTAAGVSAAVLGYTAYKTIKSIFGGAGKIKDIMTSGPFGKITGPVPVYVVNKRMSLIDLPNSVRDPNSGLPVPTIPGESKLAKVGSVLGKVTMVAGAGYAGYEAGGLLNSGMGWLSGKATGGKYKGDGFIGDMLYDLLHRQKEEKQKPAEVGGKIQIEIKQDGRAVVTGMQSNNPAVKLDVSTGLLFAAR